MLKFTTLKFLIFDPTCFDPLGPSSGSLNLVWLKLHFCRINQQKYIVISFAVLWQHARCTALSTHSTTWKTCRHNTAIFI